MTIPPSDPWWATLLWCLLGAGIAVLALFRIRRY